MKPSISRVTLSLLIGLAMGALASRAQAQAAATDFMLDDFEIDGPTNSLFGYWFFYGDAADQGNSRITTCDSLTLTFDTSSVAAPGYNGSLEAARMAFVLGDKLPSCGPSCTYDPEVAIGTDLRVGDTVTNLTGATAITFYARAAKPVSVNFVVNLASVKDFAHYRQTVDVGAAWKQYTVQLKASAAFAQPTWGKPVPWNSAEVQTLNWVVTRTLNKTLTEDTLLIDDVKIMGWDPANASMVRAGYRSAGKGLGMRSGPSGLTLTLPEAMRAKSGLLRIDDASGRQVARALHMQGQETVFVSAQSMRGSHGPFFVRELVR